MADINAYALGLELQLQTKSAMESLTKFEKQIQGIETKMAQFGMPPSVAVEFEKQAKAAGLDALARHELEKSANALMEVERDLKQLHDEMSGSAEHLNVSFEEQAKREQKLLEKRENAIKVMKELGKSYKDFNKDEQEIFKLGVDVIKQTEDTIDKNIELNEQFEKHSKAVKLLSPLLKMLGISEAEASQFAFAYGKGLGFASIALTMLAKGLQEVMAMQEAYAKTTFRALGSQYELIQQSNALRSTLGATTEQAVKTLTALANVGFRASDSISELAEANYMFSRSTGVTEDTTASYQRRLTSMGYSAEEATTSLGKMSAMIRNSGLSAQTAGNIINGLNKTLMRLNFAFGKKQAKETGETIAKFGAAAHASGGEAEALTSALGVLSVDTAELQRVMGATGMEFDATASRSQNLEKLMANAANGFRGLAIPAEYASKAMRDMGFEDVILNSDLMNKKAKELGMTFNQFTGSMDQGANLTEDFNNAMATFKDSLHRILAPLLTLGAQLLDVVGPAIVMLLKPIVMLATAIGSMITWLMKIPGVGLLVKGAIMAMIVPSIFKAITAFTGLGKLFPGVMKGLGGVTNMMKAATPTVLSLGSALLKQVTSGKLFSKETGNIISRLGGVAKVVLTTGSAATQAAGAAGTLAGAAEGATGGLMGMGGGALSAAMNFAKLHPVITAVVAAVGAAFLIVPKLFEMFDKGNDSTKALSIALMALFAPLVIFYVQLRALWAILKGVWEVVSELLTEAFKPLVDVWKELAGGPGKQTVSLMEFMNKAMHKVTLVAKILFKAFTPIVLIFKAIGVVVKFVAEAIKWMVDQFKPLIEWVDKAIQKVSKFLGIEDKAAEESEEAVSETRTEWEKMWGTHKQVNEALERQQELMRDTAKEAKAFNPEIIQTIKAQGAAPTKQAEPVISPTITDKTARAKTQEHNEKLLATSITMNDILGKLLGITIKSDSKADVNELVELLKTWLPKIAEEKSGGLATAANQWL